MRYTTKPVNKTGARFELVEGSAKELYNEITGRLQEFYENQNSKINIPPTPQFERLPQRQYTLNPITFMKEEGKKLLNHGSIAVSYFKGRAPYLKPSSTEREIDFPTSYKPKAGKAYESLTIFFNTTPVNTVKTDIAWANETQRDNFLTSLEDRL